MTTSECGDVVVECAQSGTPQRQRRPALVVLAIGAAPLQDGVTSGLLRPSWVRLAKIVCLEKRAITRHLGLLRVPDDTRLGELWRTVSALSPPRP